MRGLKAVGPVLALVAAVAGCSSDAGASEQQLTDWRENYCQQLGAWQRAHDEESPDAAGDEEAGAIASDVFAAMQPLTDEPVGAGRTLAEATAAAMNSDESEALGLIVTYCGDNGFETLTR
ncbi:hypothetical protein G3I41_07830 [Streptomyces sp. SID9727]|nr:hypothetical protein [Streptomyces sp. SID9727]